ncbi:MAG: phenylacetate--CoA ligase [Bacillaceae bacterium]|nr:phenylacetate--CoA ligase [Bacillaceae bacterium]
MIFNPEMEQMEKSEKEKLQLSRLQETAKRVYENVPFYRQKFDEAGVKPEDVKSLDDLQKLPFTKKQDLRDNYPFGLFAAEMKDVVRIHGSSGTKGKPTIVGYTRNDLDMWSELVARSIAAAGGQPGDMFHNAYGYGLFTGGLGLHYGAERLGCTTTPVSGGNTPRQITLIQDFQPRGIAGTPSYILNIAETMEKMGLDPRETSMEYGIFGAEPWSEEMRATLEEKLNLKAIDIYGLSEVLGPGVSIECHEAQDGLHIQDDNFIAEIIDPKTGEKLDYGEEGELVFTSLTKEAFPVIRYRTGDIASLNPEPCKCGRTTIRMSRIKGRYDDMLIIRGVNVFPLEIEEPLLTVSELAPHYQLVVTKEGPLDKVELQVEVEEKFLAGLDMPKFDPEHSALLKLQGKLSKIIRDTLNVTTGIRIMEPGSIPRSEGKAVRVVDKRNQ